MALGAGACRFQTLPCISPQQRIGLMRPGFQPGRRNTRGCDSRGRNAAPLVASGIVRIRSISHRECGSHGRGRNDLVDGTCFAWWLDRVLPQTIEQLMVTLLTAIDERPRLSSLSRFDPSLELQFRESYFRRVLPTVRLAAPAMFALLLLALRLTMSTVTVRDLWIDLPEMAFWAAVFALTWVPNFWRVWQPVLVSLALLTSVIVTLQLAPALMAALTNPPGLGIAGMYIGNGSASPPGGAGPSLAQEKFQFVLQCIAFLVPLAMLRLQFTWSALLYGGVAAVAGWAFRTYFPIGDNALLDLHYVLMPALFVLFPLLLTTFFQEHLSRTAFWATQQLEAERNDVERKHREAESKLHVLAQAIGSIVHDLGNPLASVQMGSETLEMFLKDEITNRALLGDLAHSVNNGAQMLNFLRLSLIEQTRVLEGKPIPVTLKPSGLRGILESSVRFQKSHVLGKRRVLLQEGDVRLCADEMKLITVWMNLIGNALKYSDGEVRVRWKEHDAPSGRSVLVAVADRGKGGRGVSRGDATKLFSAFGRLEAHAQIEGTGLGLISAQKILEAHGGQIWIEGHEDGTWNSARFTTSRGDFPSLLEDGDRTAFVALCPLAESRVPRLRGEPVLLATAAR